MKKPKVHHNVGLDMKHRELKTRVIEPPTIDVGEDGILGNPEDALRTGAELAEDFQSEDAVY